MKGLGLEDLRGSQLITFLPPNNGRNLDGVLDVEEQVRFIQAFSGTITEEEIGEAVGDLDLDGLIDFYGEWLSPA